MKSADQYFRELEQRRQCVIDKLISNQIPNKLGELIPVDNDCIWHAGYCEYDDPEKFVLEEGYFLDSTRARAFQCEGCKRISTFSGCIHQHTQIEVFKINNGLREGMEFRIQMSDCNYAPVLHFNTLKNELRTPKQVHDTFVHYIVQHILEKENIWAIERIYDTYICGNKIISIRENPKIHCLILSTKPDILAVNETSNAEICEEKLEKIETEIIGQRKVRKTLARSSICTLIQILLLLRPYHFVFGGVSKDSFIFNTIPCQGRLGNIQYDSKDTIKIKDFTRSSIKTGKCKNDTRLVPDTPILDTISRHSEAKIQIHHNHKTSHTQHKTSKSIHNGSKIENSSSSIEKCKLYRLTFNLCGTPEDLESARHIHFSEEINFSLNIYLALCALMCIKPLHDKILEDKEAKKIWFSIWPHGECQAISMAQKLNHSSGSSIDILRILTPEDLYLQPILNN